ncbi:MAG: acetyl-CoA carboxylase [Oscillospiraceae bacterium]|nr:acetyl-CoA carboxylase [Oscillospiraceae bacterium]
MAFTKTLAEMEQSVPDSEARKRLGKLLDEGSFRELDKFLSADGEISSVIAGRGEIWGNPVCVFAQDSSVKGGALNKSAALKIKRTFELAAKTGVPVVGLYDSKGADINEGMAVLSEYGEIMKASAAASGVVPQIAVVTGVCAGCAAMLAEMADITVMSEEAELFLTSPFNTPDGKIEGAGKAANAAKSGVADILAKNADEAIEKVKQLILVLPANNLDMGCADESEQSGGTVSAALKGEKLAEAVANKGSVIELGAKFGSAAYTAIAGIGYRAVAVVSTDKAEKLTADDAAKIARFVQFADVFSIPVITFVNTDGFEGSSSAELSGSIRKCARLAQIYASATTVKVNIITGNAFGAAYAAFGAADATYAWENAQIAPMAPEAGKVFMGEELVVNPFAAASLGMVDGVIAAEDTRAAVIEALECFIDKREVSPARKRPNIAF